MIAGFKFFIEETDILIAALTGDLFDGQVCIDQKGCCPGEFFCLDVCLKVLPVFADRGKTILLGCLNRVGKFGRDVKKDVKMRFYLLEKVSIIQVR